MKLKSKVKRSQLALEFIINFIYKLFEGAK